MMANGALHPGRLMFTMPVNAEVTTWTAATLPTNWTQWRHRWEYSHATRFALQLIGFGVLVCSLLVEHFNLVGRQS
jgi:hypothetical protein